MRPMLVAVLAFASGVACGLIEDAGDRLDASQAKAVCNDSCNRQRQCDDEFNIDSCKDKCGASGAAWYLCPDAPDIADYIEMCNELPCNEISQCLNGRPDC